ncbi:ATPase [Candidatus Nitromaritima sp. SCGC AAA799-A02]|nr:ATPase [Candidatus Nitromaritima sp. SCGC AAA799-C22]KMP12608.1 ATPase [Candidatus Nitromaritima sp. SCGC AAA799-A02]
MTMPQQSIAKLQKNIESVIIGKPDVVQLAITTLLARGHLLIEDVPGVGKTSLGHALARSVDLDFKRIQFTSDILPSDIVGVTIYDQEDKQFHFKKGPLFSNIVLADEINRSTPRTQSALLEAMNEQQVSVDNTTYDLEDPFMVIATQNPIESHGANPLPESQMDRFMTYLSMGYPSPEDERNLLRSHPVRKKPGEIESVLDKVDVIKLQNQVEQIKVEDVLVDYIMSIVTATRRSKHLSLGLSPRGGLTLQHAARARALVHGRDYCIPDDIKQLAIPILCHRVIPESRHGSPTRRHADTAAIINDIMDNVEIPV